MSDGFDLKVAEANKAFVIEHFDRLVNRRELDAVESDFAPDFVDHDGPGGRTIDRSTDLAFMTELQARFPDLRVTVLDAVAERDMVVVRNRWTATDPAGTPHEFHGFVQWRLRDHLIVERWATVTAPAPVHAGAGA